MKNNIFKKILSVIVFLILIVILTYNTIIIVKSFIEPNKTPNFLGIKTYIIVSGSMEPNINIGDMVIVKEVDESKLKVGDIISYRNGQNVITHRITKINIDNENIQYITKGDNNNTEDSVVLTIDSIEGKVIKKIPYIGKFILFMQNKLAIIILVVLFFIYFLNRKNKKEELI